MLKCLSLAAVVALSAADCSNACSGHGLCRDHDSCVCDPGYVGNDCSQRACPSELAFVDTPRGDLNHDGVVTTAWVKSQFSGANDYEQFPVLGDGNAFVAASGEGHFYTECSGKGECDRSSGECKCYNGFTGSACQRTTCPKDCSGNGICRTLKEIAAGSLNKREVSSFAGSNSYSGVTQNFEYRLWDAEKSQACVCDPGFTGTDCSVRQCPRGDDPLTTSPQFCGNVPCAWEQQKFTLDSTGATTYKIAFTDYLNNVNYAYATVDVSGNKDGLGYVSGADQKTKLAGPTTVAGQLQAALRAIPGGLLQRVEVYPLSGDLTNADSRTFAVTFVGVSGNVEMLSVKKFDGPGSDAVVTATVTGNFESIECSGRGLCDGSSGLCKCFTGYNGASCEFLHALSAGSA